MSEWRKEKLGVAVSEGNGKIHTGPFGSQLHASDYVPEGIPCIMPANMKNGRVDLSSIAFISKDDSQRLSKYLVQAGDIVFSRRGDVTQKALIMKDEEGLFCGTGCLLIRPGNIFNSAFLAYFLSTDPIKRWLIGQSIGGTMPTLNTGILKSLPISVPEKDVQTKISAVLAALDEKIELNNRLNAELEAMAKTLYDYWFVQFDFPDANGRPYKSSGGKMVYNSQLKREIPVGWTGRELYSITNVSNLSVNPLLTPEKKFKHYSIPVYDDIGTYRIESGVEIRSNKFLVEDNDILVSKLNPHFPRIIYSATEEDLICSTEFVVWRACDKATKSWLYQIAKSEHFRVYCAQSSAGTSHSHSRVSPDIMMQYPIPFDETVWRRFGKMVEPMIEKTVKNLHEIVQLSELRDWLLPMLMNGQVSVGKKGAKL